MIPPIIHYVWVGPGRIPEAQQRYIAQWQAFHPAFSIRRWNESNSDLSSPYIAKALANRKWANASNLIRYHALYEHGGIYLDTDLQVIRPLDPLLAEDCFFGFQREADHADLVNNAIIGVRPRHWFIKKLIDRLTGTFDGTEKASLSAPTLLTQLLLEEGLVPRDTGEIQAVKGIRVFPREYFYPYDWEQHPSEMNITPRTYSIHHWTLSWDVPPERYFMQAVGELPGLFAKAVRWRAARLMSLGQPKS